MTSQFLLAKLSSLMLLKDHHFVMKEVQILRFDGHQSGDNSP